jgi:hypothetical protein
MLKNQWLITINDIIDTPQLYEIAIKGNILDKNEFNPSAHYIVINKLRMEMEKEYAENRDFWSFRYDMDLYKNIHNAIISDKVHYNSNFDQLLNQRINAIVKHAFTVHVSKKLICEFIEKNVQKCYNNGIWKCVVEKESFTMYLFHKRGLQLINWKNLNHFRVIHSINFYDFIIILYNIPHEMNNYRYDGPSQSTLIDYKHKIIINSFSAEISEILVKMVFEFGNTVLDDELRYKEFTVILRQLIAD